MDSVCVSSDRESSLKDPEISSSGLRKGALSDCACREPSIFATPDYPTAVEIFRRLKLCEHTSLLVGKLTCFYNEFLFDFVGVRGGNTSGFRRRFGRT